MVYHAASTFGFADRATKCPELTRFAAHFRRFDPPYRTTGRNDPNIQSDEEEVMTSAKATAQRPGRSQEQSNLVRRYGKIGISAVAAALRYQGKTKNTAYAPVVHRVTDRTLEASA